MAHADEGSKASLLGMALVACAPLSVGVVAWLIASAFTDSQFVRGWLAVLAVLGVVYFCISATRDVAEPLDADDPSDASDTDAPDVGEPVRPPSTQLPVKSRPGPRYIMTPHDAELAAADWMRWMGYSDASATVVGADKGIGVHATTAIAQVKIETVPVGRPAIQKVAGAAAIRGKTALFFSLSGYRPTAQEEANAGNVAFFQIDRHGVPSPVNAAAERIFAATLATSPGHVPAPNDISPNHAPHRPDHPHAPQSEREKVAWLNDQVYEGYDTTYGRLERVTADLKMAENHLYRLLSKKRRNPRGVGEMRKRVTELKRERARIAKALGKR